MLCPSIGFGSNLASRETRHPGEGDDGGEHLIGRPPLTFCKGGASTRSSPRRPTPVLAPLNFHTGLEQLLREEIEDFGDLQLTTT